MNQSTRAQISHSVLHPDWVAGEAARRYALNGKIDGYLLYRGMNDVYMIRGVDSRYVRHARVAQELARCRCRGLSADSGNGAQFGSGGPQHAAVS